MRSRARTCRAFTLIELLIVISIIGILTGLLIPIVGKLMDNARKARTRALVMVCQQACGRYRKDFNGYPWCKSSLVKEHMKAGKPDLVRIRTIDVFKELRGRGSRNAAENYLSGLDPRLVRDLGSGETLVDGWGREIVFRVDPGDMLPLVYSFGRNGKDETGDGTTTDPLGLPPIYYLFRLAGESDDIPSR